MKFCILYTTPFMQQGNPPVKIQYFLEASSKEEAIKKLKANFDPEDQLTILKAEPAK